MIFCPFPNRNLGNTSDYLRIVLLKQMFFDTRSNMQSKFCDSSVIDAKKKGKHQNFIQKKDENKCAYYILKNAKFFSKVINDY